LYNARMLEAFPDFVAAIQRRCITSGINAAHCSQ